MDGAEAEAIKRDQAQHPNCSYSTAVQETCKSVDGDLTCEMLTRIMRHCPRQRPVEIYSRTTQEQNPEGVMQGRGPPMFGGGSEEGMFGLPGDMLKEFGMDPFGMLEDMFRGGAGQAQPPKQRAPQPSVPPHQWGPKGDFPATPQGPVERV